VLIAVGFAVLKYHLYNIEHLGHRTLVYDARTATLALIYFAGLATTQVCPRTRRPRGAATTCYRGLHLVIVAIFNPLKHRIQLLTDRRFDRRKYDAAKTLKVFSARPRDGTPPRPIGRRLGKGDEGYDAARPRLFMAPPRYATDGERTARLTEAAPSKVLARLCGRRIACPDLRPQGNASALSFASPLRWARRSSLALV
jgi:hypothetical protein